MNAKLCALTLLLLALTGLTAAHAGVSRSGEAITFEETVLTGDPIAAEGLTAHLTQSSRGQVFFRTALPFGREPETAVSFSKSPHSPGNYDSSPVRLSVALSSSWESFGGDLDPAELPPAHWTLTEPLLEATPAGGTTTQTLELSNAWNAVPLNWRILLSQQDLHSLSVPSPLLTALQEGFQYPVPEGQQVRLSVSRNDDGQWVQWELEDLSQRLQAEALSCTARDYTYFLPQLWDGDQLLPSAPLGRGVYRLPNTARPLTAEDLACVYLLEEAQQPLALSADITGRFALLAVQEGNRTALLVLDAETQQPVQSFDLPAADSVSLLAGEGCVLALLPDDSFRLFSLDPSGPGEPLLTGQLPQSQEFPFFLGRRTQVAWDGQRMALLCPAEYWRDLPAPSLLLGIWDEAGLRYCGGYGNSLDRCTDENGVPLCDYFGPDAVTLDWA